MTKKGLLFEEQLSHAEAISATYFSVTKVQDAAVRIAAFLAGLDEPELSAVARRVVREVDELHRLVKARNPEPWNFIEVEGEEPM